MEGQNDATFPKHPEEEETSSNRTTQEEELHQNHHLRTVRQKQTTGGLKETPLLCTNLIPGSVQETDNFRFA